MIVGNWMQTVGQAWLVLTLTRSPFLLGVITNGNADVQRVGLADALVHEPELIILDEPTIGLDAVAKLAMRAFIRRINRERGVTVLLTTHDMDDIEALCSRVLVIHPEDRARAEALGVPGLELVEGGHMLPMTQSERCIALVRRVAERQQGMRAA